MAMKFVVEDITEVSENLRGEYVQGEDKKWYLDIDGTIPELEESKSKVAEFRDNNILLLKEKEANEAKLKSFEGIDPKKYQELQQKVVGLQDGATGVEIKIQQAVAAAVTPLQDQLTTMQKEKEEATATLKRRELEGDLTKVGIKAGVDEKAMPDFLARGLSLFNQDGVAMDGDKPVFSRKKPSEKMSMTEWAGDLLKEAPHLFRISKGGGAGGSGERTREGKRIISGVDPLDFGRNLEDIAKGNVVVTE
jgi:hypothetical protein